MALLRWYKIYEKNTRDRQAFNIYSLLLQTLLWVNHTAEIQGNTLFSVCVPILQILAQLCEVIWSSVCKNSTTYKNAIVSRRGFQKWVTIVSRSPKDRILNGALSEAACGSVSLETSPEKIQRCSQGTQLKTKINYPKIPLHNDSQVTLFKVAALMRQRLILLGL